MVLDNIWTATQCHCPAITERNSNPILLSSSPQAHAPLTEFPVVVVVEGYQEENHCDYADEEQDKPHGHRVAHVKPLQNGQIIVTAF